MNENLELRKVIALEKIADSLEKLTEDKGLTATQIIENVAEEIAPFEPAVARLIMQYVK